MQRTSCRSVQRRGAPLHCGGSSHSVHRAQPATGPAALQSGSGASIPPPPRRARSMCDYPPNFQGEQSGQRRVLLIGVWACWRGPGLLAAYWHAGMIWQSPKGHAYLTPLEEIVGAQRPPVRLRLLGSSRGCWQEEACRRGHAACSEGARSACAAKPCRAEEATLCPLRMPARMGPAFRSALGQRSLRTPWAPGSAVQVVVGAGSGLPSGVGEPLAGQRRTNTHVSLQPAMQWRGPRGRGPGGRGCACVGQGGVKGCKLSDGPAEQWRARLRRTRGSHDAGRGHAAPGRAQHARALSLLRVAPLICDERSGIPSMCASPEEEGGTRRVDVACQCPVVS